MFKIYVDGLDSPADAILDVEAFFSQVKLTGDAAERFFIREIDYGTYNDNFTFFDRNLCKLYRENLSTGCKIALIVYHYPNKVINCIEAGDNAISAIFRVCERGNLIFSNVRHSISDWKSVSTEILFNNFLFSSVKEFSDYMADLWPQQPSKHLMEDYYDCII